MKITSIRLDRMRLPLDPPFHPAWDPVPRRHFDATLVTVETDEGLTGHGSGDTMDGFEPFEPLFTGRDPLAIAGHVGTLESIGFHAGRYWPLEAALWDTRAAVGDEVTLMADLNQWWPMPGRIDPDGCLTVPDAPGLGARIDPEAVTRHALPA